MARVLGMPDDTPEPAGEKQRTRTARLGPTLEALGVAYGVTRERIRQIQARTERRVRVRLEREQALDWVVGAVRSLLGVSFPLGALGLVPELASVATPTGDPKLDTDRDTALRALLWFAGFDLTSGGWATRAGRTPESLVQELTFLGVERGSLGSDEAREALVAQGVVTPAVEVLLRQDPPGLRRFGDTYLPWGVSLTDKAVTILRWFQRPATAEEILQEIGQEASLRGFTDRLFGDDRFVRTSKATFALREWGLESYSGISSEIALRISRADGPVSVEALVEEFTTKFGVAASSVRQYANAPRFVVENGHVRHRRPDEPVEMSPSDPEDDPNVERTPKGNLRYTIKVVPDTLRGSGRVMSKGLALALGARPGWYLNYNYNSASETMVWVSWPVESPSGPAIGSVKALAESVGAELGDALVLEFDPGLHTVTAERVLRQ